jgi:hypothetical protein
VLRKSPTPNERPALAIVASPGTQLPACVQVATAPGFLCCTAYTAAKVSEPSRYSSTWEIRYIDRGGQPREREYRGDRDLEPGQHLCEREDWDGPSVVIRHIVQPRDINREGIAEAELGPPPSTNADVRVVQQKSRSMAAGPSIPSVQHGAGG